jgi:hypothetical protein
MLTHSLVLISPPTGMWLKFVPLVCALGYSLLLTRYLSPGKIFRSQALSTADDYVLQAPPVLLRKESLIQGVTGPKV